MQTVVNGLLTHYEICGQSRSNPLLILHGWGNSLDNWKAIAQSLASQYQVILLDLPGFGQTAKAPSDYDLFAYADFVHHFIRQKNLTNLILLGHSLGGKISIVLAAKHPHLFRYLILVCPSGVEKRSFSVQLKLFFINLAKSLPLSNQLFSPLKNTLASSDYRRAGPLTKTFLNIINQPVDRFAARLTLPTLILWGDRDRELPPKWSKKLSSLIPHSDLRIIWGSGHHPHLEKPDTFLNILAEYL